MKILTTISLIFGFMSLFGIVVVFFFSDANPIPIYPILTNVNPKDGMIAIFLLFISWLMLTFGLPAYLEWDMRG
jgi:hypothetical protein